jgi:hypothetical protein
LIMRLRGSSMPPSLYRSTTLVVHNGDRTLSVEEASFLVTVFSRVFAVNVTDSIRQAVGSDRLMAIPIGLENAHWQGAGRLELFPAPGRFGELPLWSERPSDVLACFDPSTNAEARGPLRTQILEEMPDAWVEPQLSQEDYVRRLRASRFVISPPGNGSDCHRTWEALYLGAIPVVLTSALSGSLASELPIWVVDKWSDFFAATELERHEIGKSLLKRGRGMLDLGYWHGQIRAEPMQFR